MTLRMLRFSFLVAKARNYKGWENSNSLMNFKVDIFNHQRWLKICTIL